MIKESISNQITRSLIDNKVIDDQDKELYAYGLQLGITALLNILTTVILGIVMGRIWESVIFLLTYIPLRSYAGGYHAKNQFRCDVLSLLLIITALTGCGLLTSYDFAGMLLLTGSGIIIFLLAPVEDFNKRLNQEEMKNYRKKSRILVSIIFGLTVLLRQFYYTDIVAPFIMVFIILAFMLIAGKIKNYVLTWQQSE
jgi:accessory gene regulator B